MSTPLLILGLFYITGKKVVARLILPSVSSAGTTIVGGTVTGTSTVPTGSSYIYIGVAESPVNSGIYTASGTVAGTVLPNGLYLVEARAVDADTDMTSYAAITAAFTGPITSDYPYIFSITPYPWSGGSGILSDGSWVISGSGGTVGPGADSVTLTFDSTGPIADADVWVTTDSIGSNVVAGTLQTDSQGKVRFLLDAGVVYYVWMQKDGENPILGRVFTAVADPTGNSFTTTPATPGTAVPEDSYSTIAEADAYFDARMFTSAWTNSDSDQKQQALNQATAIINLFRYVGCKTDSTQDFEFPRKYIQFEGILLPEDKVPTEILEAQFEIALSLRKGIDPQREISSIGVTSRGFASVRTTYDSNRSIPEYILNGVPSSLAWALMSPFFLRDTSRSLHLRRVS